MLTGVAPQPPAQDKPSSQHDRAPRDGGANQAPAQAEALLNRWLPGLFRPGLVHRACWTALPYVLTGHNADALGFTNLVVVISHCGSLCRTTQPGHRHGLTNCPTCWPPQAASPPACRTNNTRTTRRETPMSADRHLHHRSTHHRSSPNQATAACHVSDAACIKRPESPSKTEPPADDNPNDADLINAVRAGTLSAYAELYQRHIASAHNLARQLARSPLEADDLVSESFTKVMDALLAGGGPDDAFRAYLLTTMRNTAYNKTRRDRKVELAHDVTTVHGTRIVAVSEPFRDTAVAGLERALITDAFARLPQRWQLVLWHTEIQGLTPAQTAPILGLTPNGVSALAYRAREGLRCNWLQAHLPDTTEKRCHAPTSCLGRWIRGGLTERENTKVEDHLQTCSRCHSLARELALENGLMEKCA